MNLNPNKNKLNGKFQSKKETEETTSTGCTCTDQCDNCKNQYIENVRTGIINGYFDLEEVKKAYQYIIGSDNPASVITMRRTILAYVG